MTWEPSPKMKTYFRYTPTNKVLTARDVRDLATMSGRVEKQCGVEYNVQSCDKEVADETSFITSMQSRGRTNILGERESLSRKQQTTRCSVLDSTETSENKLATREKSTTECSTWISPTNLRSFFSAVVVIVAMCVGWHVYVTVPALDVRFQQETCRLSDELEHFKNGLKEQKARLQAVQVSLEETVEELISKQLLKPFRKLKNELVKDRENAENISKTMIHNWFKNASAFIQRFTGDMKEDIEKSMFETISKTMEEVREDTRLLESELHASVKEINASLQNTGRALEVDQETFQMFIRDMIMRNVISKESAVTFVAVITFVVIILVVVTYNNTCLLRELQMTIQNRKHLTTAAVNAPFEDNELGKGETEAHKIHEEVADAYAVADDVRKDVTLDPNLVRKGANVKSEEQGLLIKDENVAQKFDQDIVKKVHVQPECNPTPCNIKAQEGAEHDVPSAHLQTGVCIVGFEPLEDLHRRVLEPIVEGIDRHQEHVINDYNAIDELPALKLFILLVDVSERPKVEKDGVQITTVQKGLELGGAVIIIFVNDPASKQLPKDVRYNKNLVSEDSPTELCGLSGKGHVFSVEDHLTETQIEQMEELKDQIFYDVP